MVIYADLIFMINFIMDLLCLYVSGKVMNFKMGKLRLVMGATLGAIYGVVSAVFTLTEPFCSFAVSFLMIYISFSIKSIVSFLKTVLLMYSVGMLLGGIMTFLQRVIYENRNSFLFKDGVDFFTFLILAAVIFVFIMLSGKIFSIYIQRKNVVCEIYAGAMSKKVTLMMDTGNTLKDPYTGKAVVIVKADVLDELLGEGGIHRNFLECSETDAIEGKLHFVSAKTVAGVCLLPVIGSLKIARCGMGKRRTELAAVVASDTSLSNDYSGNDGIIPFTLESSF